MSRVAWIADPPEKIKDLLYKIKTNLISEEDDAEAVFWFEALERKLVYKFYRMRKNILGKNREKIIFVINSSGGDIDAAYLLVEILRSCCKKLEVVVSSWAKSAATLVCLAADKIYMTGIAELGPLDAQIKEPGEAYFRSVLDEYLAILQIRREAFQALDYAVQLIMHRSRGMKVPDVLPLASEFVANLMSPLYNQISPETLGRRARQLDIGLQYAKRVLQRYGKPNTDIDRLLDRLVYEYPSHSFCINYNEAKELGLPVQLIEEEENLELLAELYFEFATDLKFVGSFYTEQVQRPKVDLETILREEGEEQIESSLPTTVNQ